MHQVRKLVKRLTSDLETSIKQAAAQVQEIEVTGRVYLNLRAREAYCHKSCQQNLVVKAERRLQAAPKEDSNTSKKKATYEDAFSNVCGYSEDRIIGASEVERMTMLRDGSAIRCRKNIQISATQKPKKRLTNTFGIEIKFWTQ